MEFNNLISDSRNDREVFNELVFCTQLHTERDVKTMKKIIECPAELFIGYDNFLKYSGDVSTIPQEYFNDFSVYDESLFHKASSLIHYLWDTDRI